DETTARSPDSASAATTAAPKARRRETVCISISLRNASGGGCVGSVDQRPRDSPGSDTRATQHLPDWRTIGMGDTSDEEAEMASLSVWGFDSPGGAFSA